MKHIMLDLETWGTKPGCDIRSIGACVFSLETGEIEQTFYVPTHNPKGWWGGRFKTLWHERPQGQLKYNLKRDTATVQWWADQSEEAQAAFNAHRCPVCDGSGRVPDYVDLSEDSGFTTCLTCTGHGYVNRPVELPGALRMFSEWLANVTQGERMSLWSHGPAFDPPILAAAYDVCKLPVPWHYRTLRDTRTMFDLAGIDNHTEWLKAHPGPLGIPHHALDDAICQAKAVAAAMATGME